MTQAVHLAAVDAITVCSFPLAMAVQTAEVREVECGETRMLVLRFANRAVTQALREERETYELIILAAFQHVGEAFAGVAFVEELP